jgi:hypothetical protein
MELNRTFSVEEIQMAKNTWKNAHHLWPWGKCKSKSH